MAELSGNIRQAWRQTNLIQRVILLTVLLACAGAGALLLGWAREPHMGMLYQGLEPEEASAIVEKIRDAGIEYKLTGGGTSINVPVEEIYSLRLTMASSGLPAGGQKGYRILDEAEFGSSPDKLRINYIRAVEGELAKTIQSFDSVTSARVHVVVPEGRLFSKQKKGASAAVRVKTKPGWTLSPRNAAAIVNLVAGSVEGLLPESVVLVANDEEIASEQKGPMGVGGNGLLAIQAREADRLAKLAQNQLITALGPDHASVIVSVVIDPTSTSDMTTTFDPEGKVTKTEKIESTATPGSGEGAKAATEEKIETEYEVGKTTVTTEKFAGKIMSLSASVLVDLSPPPTPQGQEPSAAPKKLLTTKDVEAMVRAAIVPGDLTEPKATVTVTETTFAGSLAAKIDMPDEGGGFTDPAFLLEMGRRFSLGILVIGALLALRMFRGPKKKGSDLSETGAHPQFASQGIGADHLLPGAETNPEALRSQITNALQNNPEEVKKLFLHWIESKQESA